VKGISASITGVGQSAVGRRLGRSPLDLTTEAGLDAIADAGLTPADIDGIATWPGEFSPSPGFSGVGAFELKDALGLDLAWFSGGFETSGQLGAIVNAAMAVSIGLANHVLCYRTVWETTAQGIVAMQQSSGVGKASTVAAAGAPVSGMLQYLAPHGAVSATHWAALLAARHMYVHGTTRSQLGALSVNQRANAALNPKAVLREAIDLDDYLNARMISEPLCLLDCDIPVDGSTAVIVSRSDAATGKNAPITIESMGTALSSRPYWDQSDDGTTMCAVDAGRQLWQQTDLRQDDVDIAQIYDGFTILTIIWLEALGFCQRGEGGPFVAEPGRISRDGRLPLNTGGGQLSAGRLHGFGHLHEACTQLWGRGAERQVAGDPEVAVVAAGGGDLAGALLLSRSR